MAALIRLRNHRHHLGACHEARIPEITGLIRHGKRGIVGFVTRRVLGRPLDEYDIYHRDIDHRVKWFAQITASVTKLHHCSITWGTREPSDLGGFIIEDSTNDVWLMDYGAGWPPGPQELPSDVVLRERAQLDSLRDEMDVVPHNRQPDSRPVSR